MRTRKTRIVKPINIKDQTMFPHACTGYLWGAKKARKAKNRGKK